MTKKTESDSSQRKNQKKKKKTLDGNNVRKKNNSDRIKKSANNSTNKNKSRKKTSEQNQSTIQKKQNKKLKKKSSERPSSKNKVRMNQNERPLKKKQNKKNKSSKPVKKVNRYTRMMEIINNNSFLSTLWSLGTVIVLFAIIYVVAIFLLPKQTVQNNYMEGTLSEGDKVIYLNMGDISQFNLVVFTNPNSKEDEVGRVVGMPGTTVSYKDGELVVDDNSAKEDIIKNFAHEYEMENPNQNYTANFAFKDIEGVTDDITKIPEDNYLILGDNRPEAKDGRTFGFVSSNDIKGKVYFRYSPISKTGIIR